MCTIDQLQTSGFKESISEDIGILIGCPWVSFWAWVTWYENYHYNNARKN